ncbi:hypothetical protein LCGC14_0721210 [marine sediment metagenome]|uniref:Uncharacterized protein n=1 Tax=marine sediment metagenome TaxID=412755 RepID=A0A0F9SXQ8_9ZZZZ
MKGKLGLSFALAMVLALVAILIGPAVQISPVDQVSNGGHDVIIGIPTIGQKITLTIGTDVEAAGTVDYVTDGVADDVQFQAALDALPAGGGKLRVLAGTYQFAAGVTRAIANITIQGTGRGTLINRNAAAPVFTAGGNNWVFRDFSTDAGGVDMGATTGFVRENLLLGVTYVGLDVSGDIIPTTNSTLDLGATALEFAQAWIDDFRNPGAIDIMPSGDTSDYITLLTTADRPLITGTGNYLVMGVDAVAGSATGVNDVLFGEDIEVDGIIYPDGGIRQAGTIDIRASGDIDDYAAFTTAANLPLLTGVGSYLSLGASAATGHGLGANDVLFGGAIEIDGILYPDSDVTLGTGTISGTGTLTIDAYTLGGAIVINNQAFEAGATNVKINTTSTSAGVIGTLTTEGTAGFTYRGSVVSTSPSATDTITTLQGVGQDNDAPQNTVVYGTYSIMIEDPSNASPDGEHEWTTLLAGGSNVAMTLGSAGNIWVDAYYEMTEIAAPGAGAANTARIYAFEGGGALTDLVAVFQDGSTDMFAQETTALDSPIFTYPSETEVRYILRKPHPGLQQFGALFPNGDFFVMRELEHHDAAKIAATTGSLGPLPTDWVITTVEQRVQKQLDILNPQLVQAQAGVVLAQANVDVASTQGELDSALAQKDLANKKVTNIQDHIALEQGRLPITME